MVILLEAILIVLGVLAFVALVVLSVVLVVSGFATYYACKLLWWATTPLREWAGFKLEVLQHHIATKLETMKLNRADAREREAASADVDETIRQAQASTRKEKRRLVNLVAEYRRMLQVLAARFQR